MDFRQTTVEQLALSVSQGELTARELTQAALDRIEAVDLELGAFVALDGDSALEQAESIDRRIAAGEDVGPLAGIPIGVKDTEDARGFATTYGSLLHADDAPAEHDSVLVDRLRQAGCIVVGKTNTPELAWKADTDNKIFGRTGNPWSMERSAGGSSGGSSAAVAAGLVPLATGSDGGGSLRIPASLCGLSTLKPSLGRIPVGGSHPPGWADLSSKGVLTRTIRDTTLALDSVIGPDPSDMRALPMPDTSWLESLSDLSVPRKVLWSPTLGYAVVDPEILAVCEAAVAALADRGTEVIEVDTVFEEDPAVPWLHLSLLSNLRVIQAVDPAEERWGEVEENLKGMLDWSRSVATVTTTLEVQDLAHAMNLRLVELFHEAPLLLTPTVAGHTPTGSGFGTVHGVEDASWVRFTYPFNLTRSPAGSVCAGFTGDGMPVGLQVVGPQHGDVVVLRALAVLEETLGLETRCPFEV